MRNATLAITVENVRLTDEELIGYGTFDNGKDKQPERIMINGYVDRLAGIVVAGATVVAQGNLRLIKDDSGIPSLSLNISQALRISLATPVSA
ncbi:MAG: hypothetical protein LH474_07460 [Chamaesiphon sp.]|nr:hypothetical protein [Chamaesiphon sp.]